MSGLVVGFVLGMFRLALRVFESSLDPNTLIYQVFVAPNWLYYEIALFVLCIVVIVVVSYMTDPPSKEKLSGLTYWTATEEHRKETRSTWNKWDVIHTVIILTLIVVFYIYFW